MYHEGAMGLCQLSAGLRIVCIGQGPQLLDGGENITLDMENFIDRENSPMIQDWHSCWESGK